MQDIVNQRVIDFINSKKESEKLTNKAMSEILGFSDAFIGRVLNKKKGASDNLIDKIIEIYPEARHKIYGITNGEIDNKPINPLPQPRPQYAAAGSINTAEGMTYAELKRLISSNEFIKEFRVIGDSMEPELSDGMVFFGTPITSYDEIINLNAYVLETHTRGTLIKRVKYDPDNRLFKCISDNKDYPTFVLYEDEVSAVYRFKAKLSFSLRDPRTVYHRLSELEEIVESLKSKLDQLD